MAPFKSNSRGLIGSISSKLQEIATLRGVVATSPNPFTPGNGYTYHIFDAPGTLTVTISGYADILLVGGGGGGGGGTSSVRGGGGGAGGFREEYNVFLPSQDYPITIGSGGSGNTGPGLSGTGGGSTTFDSQPVPTGGVPFRTSPSEEITQILVGGGGYGSGTGAGGTAPLGSGGGGAGPVGAGGLALSPYGHPGSPAKGPPGSAGGGGGGAYSIAPAPGNSSFYGGDGGNGRVAFAGDTGIPTDYGTFGPPDQFGGNGRCFAGGGGGSGSPPQNTYGGDGTYGGGGGFPSLGRTSPSPVSILDGLENTGGGGMGNYYPFASGNGAPGIVIVRCKVNPT